MSRKRICSVLLACCMLYPGFSALKPAPDLPHAAAVRAAAVQEDAEPVISTASAEEYTMTTAAASAEQSATEAIASAEQSATEAAASAEQSATEATASAEQSATEATASAEETTTATTAEETTTTTTTAAAPRAEFSAEIPGNYPGGRTKLTLSLRENPGLEALGVQIRLPGVLTPLLPDGKPQIETGAALSGGQLSAVYNAEKHVLSLTYAGDAPGAAQELLLTVPLTIAESAVIGEPYAWEAGIDSMYPGLPPEEPLELTFMPTEPLLRSLPETLTLTGQGETVSLTLDPLPPEGSCTWKSSDPEVVTVDAAGDLTAVGNGEAEITVVCETRTYICRVTADIARRITPESPEITEKGGTLALALTPAPVHAVTWKSSDESIAVIAEDGTVTAFANGHAEITAECEGISCSTVLRVHFPCTLNYTQYAVKRTGETVQLILQDAPADETLQWQSGDESVASVDAQGLVTFTGEGRTEITVSCGGDSYVCAVMNLPYLPGDIDNSGAVDSKDANLALRHYNLVYVIEAESTLDAAAQLAGDVDGDGIVGLRDASAILWYFTYEILDADPQWDKILALLA